MINTDNLVVPVEQLRREQDPSEFQFDCTDELLPLLEFIGQERALRSLQFGLGVDKTGYNIFVTGLTGTGKTTAILEHIQRTVEQKRAAAATEVPSDWCYLFNFEDPDRPRAVRMPPGAGKDLRNQLEVLLSSVRRSLTNAFTSEEYNQRRREILEKGQQEAQPLIDQAEKKGEEAGFVLRFSPTAVNLIPMADGKPMSAEEFTALDAAHRHEIEARQQPISEMIEQVRERLRAIESDVNDNLRELDRQTAEWVVSGAFGERLERYKENREIVHFLTQLKEFTLASAEILRSQTEQTAAVTAAPVSTVPGPPVPLDVKLVITGDPMSYFMLSSYDEEFWEIFKVKADFDTQIDRTAANVLGYAGFVCACAEREGLRHFERDAVAAMVAHGSRMVDDQEKISARFGRLRDLVVEADYWAGAEGAQRVNAAHVERAINERVYRLNMVEERIREMIRRGMIIVDLHGSVTGQVNGLAVHDFGDFSFGRPSRITARTFLGQRR